MTPLILASTSVYRRELLLKLGTPFTAQKPEFDEDNAKLQSSVQKLSPAERCLYLGTAKAKSLATKENCVIGSDQMLVLGDEVLGKSGTKTMACEQLKKMQGKTHELLTSLCVIHGLETRQYLNRTSLSMAKLTDSQIQDYVELDQPMDCAGSYKIEKHGISLFTKIDCEDFTAIQGLPLLALSGFLKEFGFQIPGSFNKGQI